MPAAAPVDKPPPLLLLLVLEGLEDGEEAEEDVPLLLADEEEANEVGEDVEDVEVVEVVADPGATVAVLNNARCILTVSPLEAWGFESQALSIVLITTLVSA